MYQQSVGNAIWKHTTLDRKDDISQVINQHKIPLNMKHIYAILNYIV